MSADGSRSEGHRRDAGRFLLTGVVSRYHNAPELNREELVEDLDRLVGLFTTDFGYVHVPLMGLNPTGAQIKDALRQFCKRDHARHQDDYLVVFLAGHGEILSRGPVRAEHVFLPADVDLNDLEGTSLKLSDVGDWILAGTSIRRLIVMLDTCMSGQGGLDFARQSLDWAADAGRMDPDAGGAVVWSAQPKQAAFPGQFTKAFVAAARGRGAGGHAQHARGLDSMMRVLTIDYPPGHKQTVGKIEVFGAPSRLDFFPNPIRDASLIDLALDEQDRRWRAHLRQEHARRDEMRGRFYPRTSYFVGRHRALTELTSWLNDPADTRSRIVAGDPGSGKTAVLAMVATMSDPVQRPSVARRDAPASAIAAEGSIDVAVYAGRLTAGQVLAGLAVQAGAEEVGESPDALGRTLASFLVAARRCSLERGRPFTAIIDALDEATAPDHLAEQVLRPIQLRGQGHVRLLLGTRRNVRDQYLGPDWARHYVVIDLDDLDYADPDSLTAMVLRILLDAQRIHPGAAGLLSRPRTAALQDLSAMTAAIARAAGRSFYMAAIMARSQAQRAVMPNPGDPAWLTSLPRDAGEAMAQDLELHFGNETGKAFDLLRPLAYARGQGLPWEDIWPTLAGALAPERSYTSLDLVDLVRNAGSYVVEAGVLEDRSLYRIYHESLADYLRNDRMSAADEKAISSALVASVPLHLDMCYDWAHAHPYIRAYLAGHAAAGGVLEDLVQDPGYLLAADPSVLLDVVDGLRTGSGMDHRMSDLTPDALAALDAYRRALPTLRSHDASEQAAYLALAALCAGANALADRIVEDGFPMPWRPRWVAWRLPRARRMFTGHNGRIPCIVTAELDGQPVVVSGGVDATVRVWDLATGHARGEPLIGHTDRVFYLAMAELEGRPVVLSGSSDRTVRVWDLATGASIGEPFLGHTDEVNAVAAGELNGRQVVVSASDDATVRVWDLATGVPMGEAFTGHVGRVYGVAVGQLEGRPVAVSGAADKTVRVWDLATGAPVGEPFAGHTDEVNAVAIGELNGRQVVVSASDDATVRVFDLATGAPVGEPFRGHAGRVFFVAPAVLDGREVVISGGRDRTVRVWDIATGAPVGEPFRGHTDEVNAVAIAELNGRQVVVSAGFDATVRTWDLRTGAALSEPAADDKDEVGAPGGGELEPFAGHTDEVNAVAIGTLPDRPVAVSGSADRTLRVWDLTTGTPVGEPLAGHTDEVNAVAIGTLPDRPVAVSGSADRTLRVWDLTTGTPVGEPLTGHTDEVNAVAIGTLPDRPVAVSGSADRTLRVWDLTTGTPVGEPLTGHTDEVNAVAISTLHDRPVAVSGSADSTLRVWDLTTGTPVGEPLTGHTSQIFSVAFREVRGQPVVVSASGDGTIRLWDPESGTALGAPLTDHTGWVWAVAFGDFEGKPVVVSAGDDALRVWTLGEVGRLDSARMSQLFVIELPSHGNVATLAAGMLVAGTNLGVVGIDLSCR